MTLKEWESDSKMGRAWRATWNEPHMKEGLEILLKLNLPCDVSPPPGVPYIDFLAGEQKRREGYYEFYRHIIALGVLQSPPAPILPADFEIPSRTPEKFT